MNNCIPKLMVAATLLALAGCATQVALQNVDNAPVVTTSGKDLTAAQVRQAIISAGTTLGWRVADAGSGRLEGTIILRTHTAVVDLPYDAKTYSIVFKRGDNLKAGDGSIHKNYNGWVQNLDRAIRAEISRL